MTVVKVLDTSSEEDDVAEDRDEGEEVSEVAKVEEGADELIVHVLVDAALAVAWLELDDSVLSMSVEVASVVVILVRPFPTVARVMTGLTEELSCDVGSTEDSSLGVDVVIFGSPTILVEGGGLLSVIAPGAVSEVI